jgi:hypothetical protein
MGIPSRDMFAAFARAEVSRHDEWDSPHSFQTLHWDGEKLTVLTYACIMTDMNPVSYPAVMTGLAREELEKHPDDPAYAYLLQTESFRVREPGPEAPAAEREQYQRDRAGRAFHERADAVEVCSAWVADIHGRLWFAEKTRGEPGIREEFYRPGSNEMGGPVIRALLAVAQATGILGHGLPGPPPGPKHGR